MLLVGLVTDIAPQGDLECQTGVEVTAGVPPTLRILLVMIFLQGLPAHPAPPKLKVRKLMWTLTEPGELVQGSLLAKPQFLVTYGIWHSCPMLVRQPKMLFLCGWSLAGAGPASPAASRLGIGGPTKKERACRGRVECFGAAFVAPLMLACGLGGPQPCMHVPAVMPPCILLWPCG